MSMIQEQLHSSGSVDSIDLGQYLEDLLINLNNSYGQDLNIDLNINVDHVRVDISKAIPCGLIANEILTNSYKHAFNNNDVSPKLELSLIEKDGQAHLTFRDNGAGFNAEPSKMGMGLELITDLTEQLDGAIKIRTENGVSIHLSFAFDK